MQSGRQFKYEVVLNSELDSKSGNSELDWFTTFSCTSPWLSSTFLMLYLSSMVFSLIPRNN
jgi:hypothetical protein